MIRVESAVDGISKAVVLLQSRTARGHTPHQRRSDVIFVLDSIEKADLLEEAATAISTNCTLWVCASFDCVAWLSVDCSALDPR